MPHVWHWKCLWERCRSDSLSCRASIPPSIHPPAVLTAVDRGQSPSRQAGIRAVGGGPDWQPQRWRERGVCLELPDVPLNRSLHDDAKGWVHMQLFVGRKGGKNRKMLLLLLCLLYKLLRLEAGLKASGFVACHYFLGLVWFGACVCLWVVFSSSHPALQISNQPAVQHCF